MSSHRDIAANNFLTKKDLKKWELLETVRIHLKPQGEVKNSPCQIFLSSQIGLLKEKWSRVA